MIEGKHDAYRAAGDSVIDNKAYVGRGPDVAEQVRNLVPDEWKVTRLAIDGAVTWSVFSQLEDLPTDTTHIVISVGGNDALGKSEVLDAPAHSVAEVLLQLAEIQDRFRAEAAPACSTRQHDATCQRQSALCTTHGSLIRTSVAWVRSGFRSSTT